MPDLNAGLLVLNLERMREGVGPVVLPSDAPRQHILRALEPLEADDGSRSRLRASQRDRAVRKAIDHLPIDRRLRLHDPALLGGAVPWIGHLGIEQRRVEPVDNAPGVATEGERLLALAQSLALGTGDD